MPVFRLDNAEYIRNTLTHEQQKEIAKMYENLYLKNKKVLEQIKNSEAFEDRLERIRLSQLVKQLEKDYKSFAPELERQIRKRSEESAQLVIDDINNHMSKVGLSIKGAYAHVAQDVVESIAAGKIYEGNWSLSGAIWRNIDKHQSDINRIIAEGAAQNLSSYKIAKALEQYVNPKAKKPWDWSKVYPGTDRAIDYNAQRLARTMISHAYQQSLERACKKNPFVESYTWRAAQNEKTCLLCMERNGQVYAKGKLPLDHPNGRCTFLVNMPNMDDIAERLGNWADGKEDLEIDKWVTDMAGVAPQAKQNAEKKEPKPKEKSTTKKEKPLTEKQKAKAKEWDEAYKNVVDFAKKTGKDPAQAVKSILGKPPKGSIHYTDSVATKAEKVVQSAKATVKKAQAQKPANTRGHLSEMTEAQRIKQVMKDLKCTEKEAKSICDSIMEYSTTSFIDVKQYQRNGTTGGNLSVKEAKRQAEDIENYIQNAPKYSGTVYRGMNVDTKTGEAFIKAAREGKTMDMGGCVSSWTSLKSHAQEMNEYGANEFNIIFTVKDSTRGASITHLQEWSDEKEVLMGKDAVWKPVDVIKKGTNSYEIKLEELK